MATKSEEGKTLINIEVRQDAPYRPIEANIGYGGKRYFAIMDYSVEYDNGFDFNVYPVVDGKPQILNGVYSDVIRGGGLDAANMLGGISDFFNNTGETNG